MELLNRRVLFGLLLSLCSLVVHAADDFAEHIAAHTSGLQSRLATIQVQFQHDVVAIDKVGQSAAAFLRSEPTIGGEPRFTGTWEITWQPVKGLKGGQLYTLILHTAGLLGIPDTLGDYRFGFETIAPDYEVTTEQLIPSANEAGVYELKGAIQTSDVEDNAAIERMLAVQFMQQPLKVKWSHLADGHRHEFSFGGIRRQTSAGSVDLYWNGVPINVSEQGSRRFEVPARREFKLLDVKAVQGDTQYVRASFSDDVDPHQNLAGLLVLGKIASTVRVEGNALKIYPETTVTGNLDVVIDGAVRSVDGVRLGHAVSQGVAFASQSPQVRFAGKGVILPENKHLSIPFEAINVHSVQVTAFRVYADNMGQFLQNNQLDGNTELARVGRHLWRKTIDLSAGKADNWNRYALDATDLLEKYPGALFRFTISINRGNANIVCSEAAVAEPVAPDAPLVDADGPDETEHSSWDYAEDYYGTNSQGSWHDRSDPCKDAYYRYASGVRVARNFLASNIGLMAKQTSGGEWHIVATDLRTAEPLPGVAVELRAYQGQSVGSVTTDAKGFAQAKALAASPFYLIARKGKQVGYLKVSAGTALPVSHFDVGGEKISQGIKGAIYGERGVWRPGDDIFLTFVLQDKDDVIPANHPVTMQLFDPRGQLAQSITNATPVGDFYTFKMHTDESAPTGNWSARAMLGGQHFALPLRIETVVPNHLKIDLDFGTESLRSDGEAQHGKLFGQWLHGASAGGLKSSVEVRMASRPTAFGRFSDYVFDDPARVYSGQSVTLFDGELDGEGRAEFDATLAAEGAPGMLNATFTSKVFEPSGAFSTNRRSLAFHPYPRYVGIRLPKGDAARGMLLTDTDHTVEVATVDADGKSVDAERVEVTLYKISWRWWWDKSGESLAEYASGSDHDKLQQSVVGTHDGRGNWKFQVKYPAWGRYLVRACDLDGGHCTGKVVYIDWPGWAGRAVEQSGGGASMLTVYADKPSYTVGEKAVIRLPETQRGRALFTVESSRGILDQRWLLLDGHNNVVELPLTAAMSPNVYVSVTLVQPHQGKSNDLPIRLYGVIPLEVDDPHTRIEPIVSADDVWAPQSKASFYVKEAAGRPMTYTVAVVDEGLLGLTNYDAPDLRRGFYRREALAVNTWDMFDQVVGAYGGELERLLALGGSDGGKDEETDEKRRFPPVVRFLGPFKLEAGRSNHHQVELPQYLGAVRVMVVAGQDGAYGRAQKSVIVRQPLSMLVTLPRVLRPGEEITVPVSLFSQLGGEHAAEVQVSADERFEVVGPARVSVPFAKAGEEMALLRLKVGQTVGKGTLHFTARSGRHRTESDVAIDILPANPASAKRTRHVVAAGENWELPVLPFGIGGTSRVTLEMSLVPPIDLNRRLRYLIQYPHGCAEQVTSRVFPQLYLPQLAQLSPEQKKEVEGNVNAGIERLRTYQTADGGFAYWPGGSAAADWVSSYVGHFLLEATRLGFYVPPEMMDGWVGYQGTVARGFVAGRAGSTLEQAYRLYTLALAKQPEAGAMNRLRESSELTGIARWLLASAYRTMGLGSAADDIVSRDTDAVEPEVHWRNTYGSALRDRAIVINALATLGRRVEAGKLAEALARELGSDNWYSTQSTAFALNALAGIYGVPGDMSGVHYEYRIGTSAPVPVTINKPIQQQELIGFPAAGEVLGVHNSSGRDIYATLTVEGVPPAGGEEAVAHGLALEVSYQAMNGEQLDPQRLSQGTQRSPHIF